MLKLYNAKGSVCSVKVRLALARKGTRLEDAFLDLQNGDQNAPDYRKLNPNSVVPTLLDNDTVVIESSVILQYVDELGDGPKLMPKHKAKKAQALVWLLRCLEIHAAIATMSFATANRAKLLKQKSPEEIETSIAAMQDPFRAAKRRDLMDNGVNSKLLEYDFYVLSRVFEDMHCTLSEQQWMNGNTFGMTDVALLAYIDRLDRLAMSDMWQQQPRIGEWLDAGRSRPSYERAMYAYVPPEMHNKNLILAEKFWPEVEKRWQAFLSSRAT